MFSRSPDNRLRFVRIAAPILLGVFVSASSARAVDIRRAAIDIRAQYAAEIERLAQWCDANGLPEEAKKTRLLFGPNDPNKLYSMVLPEEIGPPKPPDDASPALVEWNARLNQLRQDPAATRFEMGRRAARTNRPGLAFELALTAIQTDPDYEPARRLLGYQKFRDRWRTAFEAKKLRDGFVYSDRFGWLPKAHLSRYEAGERFFNGRWISVEEDARRHADIQSGWDVESEHYAIRTNLSLEAGVALGVKLERLYRLWRQLFIGYFSTEADVAALFEGRNRTKPSVADRHRVVYFRDRDDYNNSLRHLMPNIDVSIGFYFEPARRAYFFADAEDGDRTLYHEATHQLFHESRPVAPHVGLRANFWIVEGIALFMESLRQENGYYALGGFDDDRLHAARVRLLRDDFYVPLAEFTAFGMEKFQRDPRIATLYSQAAGLTHFLVFYDNGRYRDALVAYLLAVYEGRDRLDALAQLTGVPYATLDKQYREFIESGGKSP